MIKVINGWEDANGKFYTQSNIKVTTDHQLLAYEKRHGYDIVKGSHIWPVGDVRSAYVRHIERSDNV